MPNQSTAAARNASAAEDRKPYRVAQIAALLDVNQATVYRAIEAGELKALRLGTGRGTIRVMPEALDEYMALSQHRAATAVTLVEVA